MTRKLAEDFRKLYAHLKREGPWVLLGRVYLMLVAFASSVILARMLTPEEYGAYKYILSVFAVCAAFSLPEAFQVVIRYVAQGHASVYKTLLHYRLTFSITGTLALIFAGFYEGKESTEMGLTMVGLALVFPAYYAYQLYDPYLQGTSQFKLLNRIYINRATVQLACLTSIYLAFGSIYLATTLSLAVVALQNAWTYRSVGRLISPTSTEPAQNYRKETLLLSIVAILPIAAEQADKILIGREVDLSSLAIFALGITLGKTINGFFKPFTTTLNAKLVHRRLSPRHYVSCLIVGTGIGWLFSLVLPPIATALYGERYSQSAIYASIILQSLGLYVANTIYYNQNIFHKTSSLSTIYINNITVPVVVLLYIGYVATSGVSADRLLLSLALVYPLKLGVSTLVMLAARFALGYGHDRL